MRSADLPIADYALIGDQRTAALVSRDGAVDWLCWPRFDSPAVLCRLLDRERGGFLQFAPRGIVSSERRYLADTNVLEIEFETRGGAARAQYFMPWPAEDSALACRIECMRGEVELEVSFTPTFDYARAATRVEANGRGATATGGEHSLRLTSDVMLRPRAMNAVAGTVGLRAGQTSWAVLASADGSFDSDSVSRMADETTSAWRSWIARCTYRGPRSQLVRRSALLLKVLTCAPTGAVVSAPTTSLPETMGGVRNWDYRFTWARDTSLGLFALQRLGYHDEAMTYWSWLERLRWRGDDLQVLYGLGGETELPERDLDHLAGYRGSRPVRVGNAAYRQRQHDLYGEVLDSAEFCQREMPEMTGEGFWDLVRRLATRSEQIWREPDQGIWEIRGPARHYVHSKVMCWVALDRAASVAERLGKDAERTRWRQEAERVRDDVLTHGVDQQRGGFVQAYGGRDLDASSLLFAIVGFVPASDPLMVDTVERIRAELMERGLVLRYRGNDDLPGKEGSFVLCTLWLSDVLALQGRLSEARALFDRVAACANDVGLLSEEVDASSGELLGNFPQAFSHLGLIRAALLLDASANRRVASTSDRAIS